MLALPGDDLEILHYLHDQLSYPWERRERAVQVLKKFRILEDIREYLRR